LYNAKSHKLTEADRIPLLHIMRKLDSLLPPGVQEEFHALRKIRNQLTHSSESELHHIDNAENVLNSYLWAINVLALNSNAYDL